MERINRTDLQNLMRNKRDLHLVEVLSKDQYQKAHLPEAVSIPLGPNFDKEVAEEIPDKTETVVVYCSDKDCDASEKAAKRLEDMGFRDVKDYAEGKEDWKRAGFEMISGSQAA